MKKILLILLLCQAAFGVTASIELTNFNAGELSPLMNSRSDFVKYPSGAKTLENFIVRSQGPISRRPGTKYIATVKDSNDPTRLIPFEYSTEDAYIIEAGDQYFRFYRNGAVIGAPYEIVSPYDSNDIFEVQFVQDAHVMRMVHPDYAPYKLTRTAHAAWTITKIDFEGGPFNAENEDTGLTITPSSDGATGGYDKYTQNEEASLSIRTPNWYGQTFQASQSYTTTGVKLKILRDGLPGTLTVSIRAVTASVPTGADLAVGTIDGDTLTTEGSGAWKEIEFTVPYALVSGTDYAIVARALTSSVGNVVRWRYDAATSSYAGGQGVQSNDGAGASWTVATNDFIFDVVAQGVSSSIITLEASDDIFDANHVDALWEITHLTEAKNLSGNFVLNWAPASNPPSASLEILEDMEFDFTTSGSWNGTVRLQRSYDEEVTWEDVVIYTSNHNGNIQWSGQQEDRDAHYRVDFDDDYTRTDRSYCVYNVSTRSFMQGGIVRIETVVDANTATATVLKTLGGTTATWRWAEGAWSTYRGFPRTIEHHEQRAVYAGSTSYPQTVWASVTSIEDTDYDDFAESVGNENDAWTYILPGMNPIQWLRSQELLMIGTTSSIGMLGQPDKPITPTFSPIYRTQAKNGSAYIQAINAVDAVLFVERGAEKIREATYTFSSARYVAPDMTILAEHITGDGVVEIDFQNRPDPILWCIRDDGQLLSFTYQRKHDVLGWSRNITGGSDSYESVAVIPGSDEDEVWTVAARTVDSSSVRYVEQFQPIDWGSDDDDMWFVDSGGTDCNSLSWLEGETVAVLADSKPIGTYTVASGVISASGYTNYVIGLPYTSTYESMPMVVRSQSGSSAGRPARITELVLDLQDTLGLHIGYDSTYLTDVQFSEDSFATVVTPFSGPKSVAYPRGTTRTPKIYINEASPIPLTIRAVYAQAEVTID